MAKKKTIESFIVRIYRRGEDDATNLVGIVEDPSTRGTEPFQSREELLRILDRKKKRAKRCS